ncbi:MAG: hypothetical protein IJ906_09260, partial [Oscillospiraceae bacterium]|nr:hypothetical protein [Oscillospiraceae bacterium]
HFSRHIGAAFCNFMQSVNAVKKTLTERRICAIIKVVFPERRNPGVSYFREKSTESQCDPDGV